MLANRLKCSASEILFFFFLSEVLVKILATAL